MIHKHGGDIYSCGKVLDFSANINFRGMPEKVRRAAVSAIDACVHYPDPECHALRTALADRENRLLEGYGKEEAVLPEHILCGNGAAELMFGLAAAYRPDRVLVAAPSFFEYEQAMAAFGCGIARFYLDRETAFAPGEKLLEAVRAFANEAQTPASRRAVILGNPNNPTGSLLSSRLLRELLALSAQKGFLLVLDESFWDFLSQADLAETFSGVLAAPDCPSVFVIRSFTKIYALPGIRFGYAVCTDTGLLARIRTLLQPWNVSHVAQEAARTAALETEFAAETAAQTEKLRRDLKCRMEELGFFVYPSSANFLLFEGPEKLKDFCLEHGILIRDCGNFPGLERPAYPYAAYRVCVRSQEENEELLKVLRQRALRREKQGG